MNLLLSAGEASGDLHGARLLKELQLRRPGLTAFGMGGARLAEAGLDTVVRSEALSVVGISEVLEKLPERRFEPQSGRLVGEHPVMTSKSYSS